MTLDDTTTVSYLNRIGVQPPQRRDYSALRALQERHVLSVPFENLDCFRRVPLELGVGAVRKIVHRRQGGGCYEQNSAFGLLLDSLGYQVTIMGARVYHGEQVKEPLRHLVLRVELDEPWLVDVAFGFGKDRNPMHPLRFGERGAQLDPQGEYQLHDGPDGDVDVFRAGVPMYRIEQHPRAVEDFELSLWWFHTYPDSPMLAALFCLLPTETGRVALKNQTLTHIVEGTKNSVELEDTEQVRAALEEYFGISVPDIPDFGTDRYELATLMADRITAGQEITAGSAA